MAERLEDLIKQFSELAKVEPMTANWSNYVDRGGHGAVIYSDSGWTEHTRTGQFRGFPTKDYIEVAWEDGIKRVFDRKLYEDVHRFYLEHFNYSRTHGSLSCKANVKLGNNLLREVAEGAIIGKYK